MSLGSLSEAMSVFDPHLLEGIVKKLCAELHNQRHLQRALSGFRMGDVPDGLAERLIAVDGSVLTALPQVVGRLSEIPKGQWRLHAPVRVLDGTLVASTLTEEPSSKVRAERAVMAAMIAADQVDMPASEDGHLFLMDHENRSAICSIKFIKQATITSVDSHELKVELSANLSRMKMVTPSNCLRFRRPLAKQVSSLTN